MKIKYTELFISVAAAELTGVLSALITMDFGRSPAIWSRYSPTITMSGGFNLPAWIFPTVWAVLYALMGISAYIVWSLDSDADKKKKALKLYAFQLAVNFSWSIIFFRFGLPWAGAAIIILMLVLAALMIMSFKRISPVAAWLNVPYFLWLLFALYLNISIAVLQ